MLEINYVLFCLVVHAADDVAGRQGVVRIVANSDPVLLLEDWNVVLFDL